MRAKRLSLSIIVLIVALVSVIYWLPTKSGGSLFKNEGEVRAALDIGSGATNLKIAKVDPKTGKILSEIFEQSIRVPYQKQLELSGNNTFDEGVMKEGIEAIKTLKQIALSYQAKKIAAVATAAFRQADNAAAFTQRIERETAVHVKIINQDEEGILAFRGALAVTPLQPQSVVVWDIGGGSMQLTMLSAPGTYVVEKGKTASVPFKNAVIEKIQHHSLAETENPNPMSVEEMKEALILAGTFAKESSPALIEKLKDPNTEVIAVGNLFNYGIRPLVNEPLVKEKALVEATMKLAGKTFAEIPELSLAEVAATNPLLVAGYMEALGIHQVKVVNVNNTDGALTYPPYWQEGSQKSEK